MRSGFLPQQNSILESCCYGVSLQSHRQVVGQHAPKRGIVRMGRHSLSIRLVLLVLMIGTISTASHAQSVASRFGVEAKISTLGIGGEAAVELTHRINVRAGYNAFNFDHTF